MPTTLTEDQQNTKRDQNNTNSRKDQLTEDQHKTDKRPTEY